MKIWYFWLSIIAVMAFGCSHQQDDATAQADALSATDQLILRVQGSDRLYTTEYVIKKIVTYEDIVRLRGRVLNHSFNLRIPQPDRKVLIPMEGTVKAYIDFSGFGPDNVVLGADSTVRIILPDPAVVLTSTKIDHAGVREYVDFGRRRFTGAELADYELQGRAAIIASIPDLGIVDTARSHAYNLLVPMLESMGYRRENITVDFDHQYTDDDYYTRLIQQLKD